jgi:hypothetical protein
VPEPRPQYDSLDAHFMSVGKTLASSRVLISKSDRLIDSHATLVAQTEAAIADTIEALTRKR